MLGTLDFTVSDQPGRLPLIIVRAQPCQRWIHSVGLQGSLGVECLDPDLFLPSLTTHIR